MTHSTKFALINLCVDHPLSLGIAAHHLSLFWTNVSGKEHEFPIRHSANADPERSLIRFN